MRIEPKENFSKRMSASRRYCSSQSLFVLTITVRWSSKEVTDEGDITMAHRCLCGGPVCFRIWRADKARCGFVAEAQSCCHHTTLHWVGWADTCRRDRGYIHSWPPK